MAYQVNITLSSNCSLTIPKEGTMIMAGYHWLWDSGFNVDLGLRPGLLAVGFSF